MMLDLSAAFDLVDHNLLLCKLEIMGFQTHALKWMKSYVNDRSQCVYIDGNFSEYLPVTVGVPQGSVLGALLYILFVNELPEVACSDTVGNKLNDGGESLCAYVDDSTCTITGLDPFDLSRNLANKYKQLASFFGDNKLVINNEKTQLLILGPKKYSDIRDKVVLDTGTVVISPSQTGKLLGLNIHESMKWKSHLVSGPLSLISNLSKRLNAVKRVSSNASFKTRLQVANACFISVLTYLIIIWGGTQDYLLKPLQVIQNRAARCVTRLSWYTPTRILLKQCGWLSLKQLIFFHTAVQIWKIQKTKQPSSISLKLQTSITRSGAEGNLLVSTYETDIGRKSFLVRGQTTWNRVPVDIRSSKNIKSFKNKLKQWVQANVSID